MIFETIAKTIAEHLDVEVSEVRPDSKMADFGIDSLDMVELIMKIEEALGVSFEDFDSAETVADLVKFAETKQA